MKYRLDARYVWYNQGTQIVLMYFIQGMPFSFEELPDTAKQDLELIHLADCERRYDPDDVYQANYYLMVEECHPDMFELELENPEILPND